MARNGSGSYAKVNTFVSGNSITASGHNQNWDDLATEMTNSVAADGQTTISGALKGSNGTKTAPAYSFSSDLDTGIYRLGSNNIGISCGDTKIYDISATGSALTGTLAVSSDFAVATSKFTVAASSGNTVVAGTLGVTGAATLSSTLAVTSDVAVGANKFTVAASTGNTVVAGTLAVTGAITASGGVTGLFAAQSDQETATSTTLAVTPGRQQFHPSAAKCWVIAQFDGTIPTGGSYNVTSITDNDTGNTSVTIATDFSSAIYSVVVTAISDSSLVSMVNSTGLAAGAFTIETRSSSSTSPTDASYCTAAVFGDQA